MAATPDRRRVLRDQGIPDDARVPPRVASLVEDAFAVYARLVRPAAVVEEVERAELDRIIRGEGRNAETIPLELIVPEAARLLLFAVTVGAPVSDEIARLFAGNDPALGYALDTIASAGADRLAGALAWEFEHEVDPGLRVLPYSPGYCGWHVTGQRALFAALRPEEIGITLNDSCLMLPLKSVSGVLVAAAAEVHEFDNAYPFCADCATQACRGRLERLQHVQQG